MHYRRWQRYGDPGPAGRLRGQAVVDGKLRCVRCEETKPTECFKPEARYRSGFASWCRECRAAACRSEYDPVSTALRTRGYRASNLKKVRDQEKQRPSNTPELSRKTSATYRARKRKAYVEDVDPAHVWERDEGVCGICQQPADRTDWHLDHVIPLSRGGAHSMANVQVSHPACNLSKHQKLPEEVASCCQVP